MKKIMRILLAAAVVLSFGLITACSGSGNGYDQTGVGERQNAPLRGGGESSINAADTGDGGKIVSEYIGEFWGFAEVQSETGDVTMHDLTLILNYDGTFELTKNTLAATGIAEIKTTGTFKYDGVFVTFTPDGGDAFMAESPAVGMLLFSALDLLGEVTALTSIMMTATETIQPETSHDGFVPPIADSPRRPDAPAPREPTVPLPPPPRHPDGTIG